MKTSDNKEQPSEQCSINLLSSRMCERGTACCETRHTQPSEHAMRAAEMIEYKSPWSTQVYVELRNAAAKAIEQHAIAPAVAERDRRIEELVDALIKITRTWNVQIEACSDNSGAAFRMFEIARDALAKHGGAHEQRMKALDELTAEAQRLGLYDDKGGTHE